MCTGDCRKANLRGWMQAQAATIRVDVRPGMPRCSALETLTSLAAGEVSQYASFILLLRVHRVAGRPVGKWPQTHPSVIRGSMAARSHNYAATMHISLPVTAKQVLRRIGKRLVSYRPLARAAPSLFCAITTAPQDNERADCFLTRLQQVAIAFATAFC